MAHEYWPVEYASDALNVLFEKENKVRKFLYQSPQLSSRRTLVKWILKVCELFKFGNATVHLAIYILDRFMDGHSILVERLNLTALACIQLAAKFEEQLGCTPTISELNSLTDNEYQLVDFIQFESFILKYMDWNFSLPTAIKFVEYYALVAVSHSEWNVQKFSSYKEFWDEIQHAIKYYLDLSVEDEGILQFKPSQVASSCVLLARRQVGVEPWWTRRLIQITRYKFSEVAACAKQLLMFSVNNAANPKRKRIESPDQGYGTEDSACTPSPPKKVRSLAQRNNENLSK